LEKNIERKGNAVLLFYIHLRMPYRFPQQQTVSRRFSIQKIGSFFGKKKIWSFETT